MNGNNLVNGVLAIIFVMIISTFAVTPSVKDLDVRRSINEFNLEPFENKTLITLEQGFLNLNFVLILSLGGPVVLEYQTWSDHPTQNQTILVSEVSYRITFNFLIYLVIKNMEVETRGSYEIHLLPTAFIVL